jgi:ubiquinone/menaquinone biosynthesis C-methylase UbiE
MNSFIWDDYLLKTRMKEEFELLSEYFQQRLNNSGAKILDIGCATGELSITLAEKGFNVIGIDYSSLMIKKAKNKIVGRSDLELSFICADFNRQLPFSAGEFDLIICRHTFNASLNKSTFTKEIKRITANNGLVFQACKYFNVGKKKNYKKGILQYLVHSLKPLVFMNKNDTVNREEIITLFEQNNFRLIDEKLSDYNYSLLFYISK